MFVAIRDLRHAKGRFALMGAVVTLITMLVVLLSGLTAGLARGNTSAITDLPADHLVFSAPAEGQKLAFTESSITPSVQQEWASVDGVVSADPVRIAMTRASGSGSGRGRSAAVAVFAVPAGSALAPRVGTDRVVLSSKAAASLEVAAGDQIELTGQLVTVEAVSGDDEFSHAPVIWAATENAPSSGLTPGNATVIALTTTGGADLAAADQALGTRTLTVAESLSGIGSYTSENGSLQLMRVLLFAISALVIGAFFTVWTVQRSGEIAILKAVGASTGYLLKDALGQALALLAIGTALGTAAASAIGAAIRAFAGTAVPFVLALPTLLFPSAVMILLGLVGAAVSLRTVTSVDPLTALGSAR
ncbi:ABC transporter permease [Terrabacter sp. Soil810]|uniref:ABC transporter permease n=1 Tax=Terrabacter sp. Soil810 TaxID=1736418 RepID=UPI00070B33A5|nr:ABC transporter permease [Terrabacter sp. Soil810]KRF40234.1 ABC transporter substrate-binding protein [Terrabacter sp. Soil810]